MDEKKTQIARVLLTKNGRGSKISIDGVEIRKVCCVAIEASPSEVPTVVVAFLPDVIDVEAEGEVTLKPATVVREPMATDPAAPPADMVLVPRYVVQDLVAGELGRLPIAVLSEALK